MSFGSLAIRDCNNYFNPNVKFPDIPHSPDTLVKPLVEQLSFVYGNTASTYDVLYKYYHAESIAYKNQLNYEKEKKTSGRYKSNAEQFTRALKAELNNATLEPLLLKWDYMWYVAILQHYKGFQNISDELVNDAQILQIFKEMESNFPMHIEAVMNIVISDRFFEEARYSQSVHEDKKRIAVHHFFALLRARNKDNMIHWAMIETLAIYGNGINQITTRSVESKNFCCKLDTAFKQLNEIHEKCAADIKELIQLEEYLGFDMDNYNCAIQKTYQDNESSATMHKGTASSIVCQKHPKLPAGTTIKSPLGIVYRVKSCKRESLYRLFIELNIDESNPCRDSFS